MLTLTHLGRIGQSRKGNFSGGKDQADVIPAGRRRHRQENANFGAFARMTVHKDLAMVCQDDVTDDTHSQANALHRRVRGIRAVKTIKDVFKLVLLHAYPLVFNAELVFVVMSGQDNPYTTPIWRIFNGIAEQMIDNLL